MYRSVPGKRPLPGKHPYTEFQGVTVAASMQTYGVYIPGKRPCGPKSRVILKCPWALTQDTTVIATYLDAIETVFILAKHALTACVHGISGCDRNCISEALCSRDIICIVRRSKIWLEYMDTCISLSLSLSLSLSHTSTGIPITQWSFNDMFLCIYLHASQFIIVIIQLS